MNIYILECGLCSMTQSFTSFYEKYGTCFTVNKGLLFVFQSRVPVSRYIYEIWTDSVFKIPNLCINRNRILLSCNQTV